MKKAFSARCRIMGTWETLLLFALAIIGVVSMSQTTASAQDAASATFVTTGEKQSKFNDAIAQGVHAYESGNFELAVRWFKSAAQLEPSDANTDQMLKASEAMLEDQLSRQSQLPSKASARERFLKTSFNEASKYYQQKDYEKAYEAFYSIWVVGGDFNGKVVKMYQASIENLAESGVQKDDMTQIPQRTSSEVAIITLSETTPTLNLASSSSSSDEPIVVVSRKTDGTPQVSAETDESARARANVLVTKANQLMAEGSWESARQSVVSALEICPGYPPAVEALDEIDRQTGCNRQQIVATYIAEGRKLLQEGYYQQAIERFRQALKVSPNDPQVLNEIARAEQMWEEARGRDNYNAKLQHKREIENMIRTAEELYKSGDVKQARDLWQQVLDIDPNNKYAQAYLDQTREAYEREIFEATARTEAAKASAVGQQLLNSPVSIQTDHAIPLTEFMSLLSMSTPSELNYTIANGANAMISASFSNKRLSDVLTAVFAPIGLAWAIDDRNIITIRPDFKTRVFPLTVDQMKQVQILLDSGEFQQNVWAQPQPPAEGASIVLDERQHSLLVTGSQIHIERVQNFLPTLHQSDSLEKVTRIYKIRKEDGDRIKSLITSILNGTSDGAMDLDRKVVVDGEDLIIHDTQENILKIEEILMNQNFLNDQGSGGLQIFSFTLAPKDLDQQNIDQVRSFAEKVVEFVSSFLYAVDGTEKAASEGRRLWFDQSTLQLHVMDTPQRLEDVKSYLESLPQFGTAKRQRTVFLKNAVAENMCDSLDRILNLASSDPLGPGGGNQVTWQLRRGDTRRFGDLTVRVMRLEPNDENDRHDDSVELQLNTGINVNTMTIREYETQMMDDYEVTAESVSARTSSGDSGSTGEGRARITIRRIPGAASGGMMDMEMMQQMMQLESATKKEEAGIEFTAIGEQNAIVIRYSNTALFTDAMDLIKQLDQPIRQVSIQTNFVEVNETRAKEMSADFTMNGLGSGRSVDWSSNNFNSRFAQDADEFRDPFSPPIQSPLNTNLLKGTTVFSMLFGSRGPQIGLNLRMLEAEGIINVVSGPTVSAIDGSEAEFKIQQLVPEDDTDDTDNPLMNFTSPLSVWNDIQFDESDDSQGDIGGIMISGVYLRVTPEITSKESILLNDLAAEIFDLGSWLGSMITPEVQDNTDSNLPYTFSGLTPKAVAATGQQSIRHKKILTNARVSNGGTIVLGGWTGEHTYDANSGIPVLRNLPYVGKLFFNRNQRTSDRTTLLIFLTCNIIE